MLQGKKPWVLMILLKTSHHPRPTELQRMEIHLTFGYRWHLKSNADYSHQISQWNQGSQNRPDSDGFSLSSMNQLQAEK